MSLYQLHKAPFVANTESDQAEAFLHDPDSNLVSYELSDEELRGRVCRSRPKRESRVRLKNT